MHGTGASAALAGLKGINLQLLSKKGASKSELSRSSWIWRVNLTFTLTCFEDCICLLANEGWPHECSVHVHHAYACGKQKANRVDSCSCSAKHMWYHRFWVEPQPLSGCVRLCWALASA